MFQTKSQIDTIFNYQSVEAYNRHDGSPYIILTFMTNCMKVYLKQHSDVLSEFLLLLLKQNPLSIYKILSLLYRHVQIKWVFIFCTMHSLTPQTPLNTA